MIRLARVGATKQPHYRVVVIEKDRARNGRSIEVVGTYNPRSTPMHVDLKRDRIAYWTSNGAQLSDRVEKLLAQPAAIAAEPVSPPAKTAAPVVPAATTAETIPTADSAAAPAPETAELAPAEPAATATEAAEASAEPAKA